MVKLQHLINNLTKSNINNENILINILACILVHKNNYNINEINNKYNIEVDMHEIDKDIIYK